MKNLAIALLLLALFVPAQDASATCTSQTVNLLGDAILYTGSCTDDNEVLITTGSMDKYDACMLMSTTGAVDVQTSLDASTYSTAPLSLTDKGGTSTNPVLVTVALRMYAFPAKFFRIRIDQNGATDAAASLMCWDYS